jgi:ATP-binding protein involved in chromosome partitioning
MISKALYQLLSLSRWTDLDYLIIDTPPGTGDIHLSLIQNYYIDEVIIVTTPQKLSIIDVIKTIDLYKKFSIPIKGLIENMSYYSADDNKKLTMFDTQNIKKLSEDYSIPIIAQIPFYPDLASCCDDGQDLRRFTHLMQFEHSAKLN